MTYGFTDHDRDLSFDGRLFRADTGMSAAILSQSSGLSVDNSEALGALSDASLRAGDILDGKFDGATVVSWLVNWREPSQRKLIFRGSIGEIHRAEGAFRAELRGLSDQLNQPRGRRYQKSCSALVGDEACGVDVSDPAYRIETALIAHEAGHRLTVGSLTQFAAGWFARGTVEIMSGHAIGAMTAIQCDQMQNGQRLLTLWEPVRGNLAAGDRLKLTAGCDKRFATCQEKFRNVERFQGFPDLPSDSWMASYPSGTLPKDGGSRR